MSLRLLCLICLICLVPWLAHATPANLGDLDDDGVFTANDLAKLVGHSSGTASLPEGLIPFADLTQDGFINDADQTALVNLILESITPQALSLASIREVSPASGEGDVAVTRETVLHFSMPLALNVAIGSFKTTLNFLVEPAYRGIWQDSPPLRFTTLFGQTDAAVVALSEFCQQQMTVIKGAAADKAWEERELEDAALRLGSATIEYYLSIGNATEAAKIPSSLRQWRRLRDEHLVEQTGLLLILARAAVVSAPQFAISRRKGYTQLMRSRFQSVDDIFEGMDRLILQFRDASDGDAFVAGYFAARSVRDLGHGPRADEPLPPSPAPRSRSALLMGGSSEIIPRHLSCLVTGSN